MLLVCSKFGFFAQHRLASATATIITRQPHHFLHTSYLVRNQAQQSSKNSLPSPSKSRDTDGKVSIGAKVKETTQTVWYTGVVIGGLVVTGVIFFTVLKELFWSQSPQSIYSDALDKCCKHPRICDTLGEPITGFCEDSGRRGRKNLRYSLYLKDGVEHMQIRFYIKGIRNRATVFAEMEKKDGRFEYLYLMAEMDNYPRERIFVLDNRKHELGFQPI